MLFWSHDTQHNDTQQNDTQHNDVQHNDVQHNDVQHNDVQHKDVQQNDTHHCRLQCGIQYQQLYAQCYAERRYSELECYHGELLYSECHHAERPYSECHHAERRYSECLHAEGRGTITFAVLIKMQFWFITAIFLP